MIQIFDIDDDRISLYKGLRFTPSLHIENKIFVAESKIVVKKLLESSIDVLSIFALPEFYTEYSKLIKLKSIDENQLFYSSPEIIKQIVGYRLHSGIMAIAKQAEQTLINELTTPIIILNNIINSENVGSIIRNAAAFNINSIIYDNETSSPWLRRAVRVSMGTIFSMKYSFSENIIDTIEFLKNLKIKIISIENTNESININNYKFEKNIALIFGSESLGINKTILELSDDIIRIPINPQIPSINVAACSAIIFNQFNYQRK